ncbi:DUF4386 family protein [Aestuariivirga litoralis]|uniref:DUF4386 family protein n=1 Tax=Aestuariivirga litoralis TaxID=2650924 RepID=UPI0018C46A3E|nr:DUF4386 family protein [Aestuariivirga litoralis]MBG1232237.1 DUF4386 family protein [Aestuariivirga litoralis]
MEHRVGQDLQQGSSCRVAKGVAAIVFAILFNIPFSILGATFDYPAILRKPAGEALDKFAEGGNGLILTWYGFAFAALALTPLAIALSITPKRVFNSPALAIGAALAGTAASITQAIGLFRWVFAIPAIAAAHADPAATEQAKFAAEQMFSTLNNWGGVAIGEHMGQWFTALFVLQLSLIQRKEGWLITSLIGFAATLCIALGTSEGLSIVLGGSGAVFSIATILGFLGLTLWLIATGINLIRRSA